MSESAQDPNAGDARLTAMKGASENADAMIRNLSMSHHRARQSHITSEVLEIVAGAEALE